MSMGGLEQAASDARGRALLLLARDILPRLGATFVGEVK